MFPDQKFYFAHRGGNEFSPENSLSSFLSAYDLGCRHLELDVRPISDGQLVVFHDSTLKRIFGSKKQIRHIESKDFARFRYSNGEPILLLSEFIKLIPADTILNIDPKTDEAADLLIHFLRQNRGLLDRVAIGTFSTSRIQSVRSGLPGVTTVASRNEAIGAFARYLLGKRLNTPAKALQLPLIPYFQPYLRAEFADYLHEQGLQMHVWTVNTLSDMGSLFERGIDAIMTDRPTIAKSFFDTRQGG